MKRRLWVGILASWVLAVPAAAAERTSVMSSADGTDRFDGTLSVRYDWAMRRSAIGREFPCDPTVPGCPATPATVSKPELDATRVTHTLDIDARIGLYHDLELRISLPVVLSDRTDLSFADGVDFTNSQIDDGSARRLFEVPHDGPSRTGVGDMRFALRWAPLAQWRQPRHPTLLLAAAYTAPTGTPRRPGNTAVGEGLHQVHIEVAASRLWRFVEPYFALHGDLRFPAPGRTLFRNYDDAPQTRVGPGHVLGMALGAEWFPWRTVRADGKAERFARIDTGVSASYTFRGREYTDLFEALGTSPCAGDPACVGSRSNKNMAAYDRTLAGAQGGPQSMDGLVDVASYGTIGAWVGAGVQPIPNLEIGLQFLYRHETAHLLTNADTGKDSDAGNDTIEWVNASGRNEYNPVFNSEVDEPGRRLRSSGADVFGVMVRISGKL
jgi:hypothetical protein